MGLLIKRRFYNNYRAAVGFLAAFLATIWLKVFCQQPARDAQPTGWATRLVNIIAAAPIAIANQLGIERGGHGKSAADKAGLCRMPVKIAARMGLAYY